MTVAVERTLEIADSYLAAWNAHDPEAVASFFAPNGRIYVNGSVSAGRIEIAAMARSFLDAIPDMSIRSDLTRSTGTHLILPWTFSGTSSTNGNRVTVSGWEYWQLNDRGLVVESRGHFDEADYQKQMG